MFQNPVRAVGLGPEGWASSVQEVGGQERWQEAGVKEAPRAAGTSCLAFPAFRGPASLLDRKVESGVWPYEVRARPLVPVCHSFSRAASFLLSL